MLVTQRLKRFGQRRGRDGGQGVLTFRTLLNSGRFDRGMGHARQELAAMEAARNRQ